MPSASPSMRLALNLAAKAQGRTHPNPLVGAVVVADGKVVGRGYHRAAGTAHAEVLALEEAGAEARGATLYVTLEPCRHQGRTPPCTDAILGAGIARVVVALLDPNPEAGGGLAVLRAHHIDTESGDGAEQALEQNLAFVSWMVRRRPAVRLKSAVTADGKVATTSGESKYLTGAVARRHVHRLRNTSDAILVGSGTVLADNPSLTCRGVAGGRDPVRVILDSRGRVPATAQIFHTGSPAPTLVYTLDSVSGTYEREIFAAGGEVVHVSRHEGRVNLSEVLRDLGERGLLDILVEGGPTVHSSFVTDGLADEWLAYWAPLLVGGPSPGPVGGAGVAHLDDVVRLVAPRTVRLGPDILYRAYFESSWKELRTRCLQASLRK